MESFFSLPKPKKCNMIYCIYNSDNIFGGTEFIYLQKYARWQHTQIYSLYAIFPRHTTKLMIKLFTLMLCIQNARGKNELNNARWGAVRSSTCNGMTRGWWCPYQCHHKLMSSYPVFFLFHPACSALDARMTLIECHIIVIIIQHLFDEPRIFLFWRSTNKNIYFPWNWKPAARKIEHK